MLSLKRIPAAESGSIAVETAIVAVPLFILLAGMIVGGYLLIFAAANVQPAATLLVNAVSVAPDQAAQVTSGMQLVVSNSDDRRQKIGDLIEMNAFYDWKDVWLRHIANVTGGLVRKGGSSQLFMHQVGERPEGLTVHLSMERPVDADGNILPMVRTHITRYSLLSQLSPSTSVLVPYVQQP